MLEVLFVYYIIAIVLDHAHLACPIVLGWSHSGFRRHMLANPAKFVLLPALCLFAAVLVGFISVSTKDPLFRALASIYLMWNAWHFGSQHFGVASLAGWRFGPRLLRQAVIIISTMVFMLVPIGGLLAVILAEIINLAHWVTDIGLTAWVSRKWQWMLLIFALGLAGFIWKTLSTDPHMCGIRPICTVVWSIPLLLALRQGLGFWHFLMSRWVWKLNDPQVKATIGRDLFRPQTT